MLNLAGAVVYLMVAGLAARAALQSGRVQRRSLAVHWRTIAVLFAGLAAWRLAGGEALVQVLARDLARNAGSYASRRELQVPLVGLAIIAGAVFTAWTFFHPHGDPDVHWSRFAAIGLLAYSVVRMISLHAVDAILYASVGPFHINHFIDLGLAITVGYFAICSEKQALTRN